jgi:hypothetical protein
LAFGRYRPEVRTNQAKRGLHRMTQVMQEKQELLVSEEKGLFFFSIEEDMLPGHLENASVFESTDLESMFPGDGCEGLRALCAVLLPEERFTKIGFMLISRERNKPRTNFKLVRVADHPCESARGRVDTALRICGFEPRFGL